MQGGRTGLILRLPGSPLLLHMLAILQIQVFWFPSTCLIILSQFSNSTGEEKWVSFKFPTRKIPTQEDCQKFEQKQGCSLHCNWKPKYPLAEHTLIFEAI